jgi:hypothetical protein
MTSAAKFGFRGLRGLSARPFLSIFRFHNPPSLRDASNYSPHSSHDMSDGALIGWIAVRFGNLVDRIHSPPPRCQAPTTVMQLADATTFMLPGVRGSMIAPPTDMTETPEPAKNPVWMLCLTS